MSSNEKITIRQLQILIILGAMGTGVIVLPRRVADLMPDTWQDGWIVALGLTVVAMAVAALICVAINAVAKANRGTENANFVQSVGAILTKPVAYFIAFAFWAKLVVVAGLEMRVFMEITGEVLLPRTPAFVVSGVVLAVCAYAAAMGMETRARVGEVLLWIMILPFIFLFIFAVVDADFSNLQPAMVTQPKRLATSVLRLGFIFTGMETLLLVKPFVPQDKPLVRPVVGAIAVAGLVITAITAVTIAAFGRGVTSEAFPVLRMMDMINLPGSFIERQEALMFSFWIITAFALGNAMLFFAGLLVKDILPIRKKRLMKGVLITTVAVFAVSNIPLTTDEIYRFLDTMYMTTGIFFLVALPILLIIAAKISTWGQSKMKPAAFMLIIVGATVLLTGCWDRVEIENRAFVVAIGIDKSENEARYAVTLSVPILNKGSENDSGDSDDETPPAHIKTAEAQTITEALKKLNAKTDKHLYYGQTKLLILGTDLLEDPALVDGVINIFGNMTEIDCRMHVLAAEDPTKILKAKPPGETSQLAHKNKSGALALDFEQFSISSNAALIPKICSSDDELKLNGAIILKNRRMEGSLNPEELRGFLWCFPNLGEGEVITATLANTKIPMKVETHTATTTFRQTPTSPNSLRVLIDITATGTVDEYPEITPEEQKKIEFALAREIYQELTNTAAKLQQKHKVDAYNWLEHLRKENYPLYQRHAKNWQEVFPTIEVIPRVKVEIKS